MARIKAFDEKEKLERALNLFWKKGFHATSMQDLVDTMGINRSSIYDTYKNKEQLFEQAIQHYRNQNIAIIESILKKDVPVKERFRLLFHTALDQSMKDSDKKGCFVINTTAELASTEPKIKAKLTENKAEFTRVFKESLERAQDEGEIMRSKDIEGLATLLFTLYNGLQVVSKLENEPTQMKHAVDEVLNLLN